MKTARHLVGACAAMVAMQWQCAQAGPGEVFVPAHRTKDGSYVPANVPPSSGGTHLATRPHRASPTASRSTRTAFLPPLLGEARPIQK
jgi:hypothetical protein